MLRIATVGTSAITRQLIEAVAISGVAEVVAVSLRRRDQAQAFANEMGVDLALEGLEQVIAHPDVDAVYIASPNLAHAGQVEACLHGGKHVLCEKPLAPTADEQARLFDLAASQGLVLLEAVRSIFDPGMELVRGLLPRLGTVRRASFAYCQRSARYDLVLAGEPVTIFDPDSAGGALYDLGVYCIHPLVHLFGEPETVQCVSVPIATGADGAGVVLAGYPGLVADLSYSKITASTTPSQIQGELATMYLDHIAMPRVITVHELGAEPEVIRVDGEPNNLVYEVRHFAELVDSGEPAVVESRRSIAAATVLDRARRAEG